jgi:aspartate carbamoyltransferase catalytic subunit
MIRGMELTDEVADGLQSVVTEQVANGVKVRMAVLSRLLNPDKRNSGARRGPEGGRDE